jgi:hypothetical protein
MTNTTPATGMENLAQALQLKYFVPLTAPFSGIFAENSTSSFLPERRACVRVVQTFHNGPAHRAGIKAGDVITGMGATDVQAKDDILLSPARARWVPYRSSIFITVVRCGTTQLSFTIKAACLLTGNCYGSLTRLHAMGSAAPSSIIPEDIAAFEPLILPCPALLPYLLLHKR